MSRPSCVALRYISLSLPGQGTQSHSDLDSWGVRADRVLCRIQSNYFSGASAEGRGGEQRPGTHATISESHRVKDAGLWEGGVCMDYHPSEVNLLPIKV